MFIKLAADAAPALEDAANLKAFKVVSTIPPEDAVAALGGAGQIEGEYAWVNPAWLKQNGPDNAAWQEGFAKMLDYASKSGWVNEAGAVRAHIEWT